MSVKNYPAINYGKEYKEKYIGALTNTEEHVVIPSEIDGIDRVLRNSTFANNKILKSIDFNHTFSVPVSCCSGCTGLMSITFGDVRQVGNSAFSGCTALQSVDCTGIETFGSNVFSGCTSLQSVDLTEVTQTGSSMFNGCTALTSVDLKDTLAVGNSTFSGCSNLTSVAMPQQNCTIGDSAFYQDTKITFTDALDHLISIGKNAFYSVGSAASEGFVYHSTVDDFVLVNESAFRYAKLEELTGKFQLAGSYAFADISSLTKIEANLHGDVLGSAFYNDRYVSDFSLSFDSSCHSLGTYAFDYFGYARETPESNWFIWDLQSSLIASVPTYAWAYNKNSVIKLPETLTVIDSYAFYYGSDMIIYLNSLPSLSSTNAFSSNTNLTIVVDCNLDADSLKNATNWATYAQYIVSGIAGYVGTLPPYNESEGVSLTWYADDAMTIQVTEATELNKVYYAVKGPTREVYCVSCRSVNAQLEISDGSQLYDKFVPVGTTVTITPIPTDPDKSMLYLLQVDGVDYTAAGSATIVADHDIKVAVLYWDGEVYPFFPRLEDNSLSQLKFASKLGVKLDTWNVGDEIKIPFNGQLYPFRLVDTSGKYIRVSDGKPAYLVFEAVNVINVGNIMKRSYNDVDSNLVSTTGDYRNEALTRLNFGDLWDTFDAEFKSAVEDVTWNYYHGWNAVMKTVNLKIFYACWSDMYTTQPTGYDPYRKPYVVPQKELDAVTIDEYYQLPTISRTKTDINGVQKSYYTCTYEVGSHAGGMNYYMLQDNQYGSRYNSGNDYIAPRFAL